jgi:hypothetical protein
LTDPQSRLIYPTSGKRSVLRSPYAGSRINLSPDAAIPAQSLNRAV